MTMTNEKFAEIIDEKLKVLMGLSIRMEKELYALKDRPIGVKNKSIVDNVLDDIAHMQVILSGVKME